MFLVTCHIEEISLDLAEHFFCHLVKPKYLKESSQ